MVQTVTITITETGLDELGKSRFDRTGSHSQAHLNKPTNCKLKFGFADTDNHLQLYTIVSTDMVVLFLHLEKTKYELGHSSL